MDTPILSPHEQKDGRNDYQDQGTEDKPCTDKLLHEKNPPYGFTPWSSP
jgi:hypothetical protein